MNATNTANTAQAASAGYEYASDKDAVTITGYSGHGGDIVIPSKIGGRPVTSIGRGAFLYCSSLDSLTLPEV